MKPKIVRKRALDKNGSRYAKYLRENGMSIRAIAAVFGVSRMAIWRDLNDEV